MTPHVAPGPVARLLWLVVDTIRSPLVVDGEAKICDWTHSPVIYGGEQLPRGQLHLDVEAKVYNRGQQPLTVIGVDRATAGTQAVAGDGTVDFKDLTLSPDGDRKKMYFTLAPTGGEPLLAEPGDRVDIRFRVTHGGLRSPRIRLSVRPSE